jgi:hypothetical protein
MSKESNHTNIRSYRYKKAAQGQNYQNSTHPFTYMYMFIYIYIHIYICTYMYINIYLHIYIHICTYFYSRYTYIHIYIYVIYMYIHIYLHINMYMCTYINLHIYNTYINIQYTPKCIRAPSIIVPIRNNNINICNIKRVRTFANYTFVLIVLK